jgi:hypothetical protein
MSRQAGAGLWSRCGGGHAKLQSINPSLTASLRPHPSPQKAFDSLELTDEKINAITDKIPQRPVGVVEGTSYTAVILAAFGVRGGGRGAGGWSVWPLRSQRGSLTALPPPHSQTPQCLAYFIYNFVITLVLEPVQQQCFNAALDKLRTDPRITVRLGSSITGTLGQRAVGGRLAAAAAILVSSPVC